MKGDCFMEKKKINRNYNIEEPQMDLDFVTCSAKDCTGLIPARNLSMDEAESYEDLYPYLPPHNEFENSD